MTRYDDQNRWPDEPGTGWSAPGAAPGSPGAAGIAAGPADQDASTERLWRPVDTPPAAGDRPVGPAMPPGPAAPGPGQVPAPMPARPPVTAVPYPGSAIPYSGPVPPPRRRRSWAAIFALTLALILAVVAGVEGYLLYRLDGRLAAANRQANADRGTDDGRLDHLEDRTGELEKRVGSAFDSAAVAAAALPSVFRVVAGDATGTAFAVGRPPTNGGTYLFTNYHVVEDVWVTGKREVFLERRDQRFPATITKIDKEHDVALLHSAQTFPRLAHATVPVKAGEPVVVVGSPLALDGSVTTGVVSAVRKIEDMAGDVIQFSAPINPGNSGGPVINSQKQVVGIASAKARNAEGIGLAVLIGTACDSMAVC